MSELQKVNHLVEAEKEDIEGVTLSQISLKNNQDNFSVTKISETKFLEEDDNVILFGDTRGSDSRSTLKSSSDFKVYSTQFIDTYSYLDAEVTREENGILMFAKDIYFDDKENILYLGKHVVGVPKDCDVYFYPLFTMIQVAEKRLILYVSEDSLSIESKNYTLNSNNITNLFIDDNGDIAINYLEGIAVFRFQDRILEVNGHRLYLKDKKQIIKINKKWIDLGSNFQINGEDSVVRYEYTYIKIPKRASLHLDNEEMTVVVDDGKEIRFLAQIDRIVYREDNYWLVFDSNSRIVLDKKGEIAFIHQDELVVLDRKNAIIRTTDISIKIFERAIVRITAEFIYLNEAVKVNIHEKLVKVAKSKFLFTGKVEIALNKAEVLFKVKNKQIRVMPYKKQLFINIGGKLVIVTVSIGIAVDSNGNIAFDYRNTLTTLDTDYFVMNVGGSIFSFGTIEDCCCEFLGNQIAVGSRKQNVLEMLNQMLAGDLTKVASQQNIQSLIEKLLCTDLNNLFITSDLFGLGVDVDILLELAKGSILEKITGSSDSYFAILNKNNIDQLIMGNKKYPITPGNNFYVPVDMEFLKGMLKFKDKKVYFVG